MKWTLENFEVFTDISRIDFDVVNGVLATAYWSEHRTAERNIQGWRASQVVFGLYDTAKDGRQVGGARVVGDGVSFGWLADVFVVPEYQGRGLGKFLISCVVDEPSCQAVGRLLLGTRDAHGLYEQHGWIPLQAPDRWMERITEGVSCLPPSID